MRRDEAPILGQRELIVRPLVGSIRWNLRERLPCMTARKARLDDVGPRERASDGA